VQVIALPSVDSPTRARVGVVGVNARGRRRRGGTPGGYSTNEYDDGVCRGDYCGEATAAVNGRKQPSNNPSTLLPDPASCSEEAHWSVSNRAILLDRALTQRGVTLGDAAPRDDLRLFLAGEKRSPEIHHGTASVCERCFCYYTLATKRRDTEIRALRPRSSLASTVVGADTVAAAAITAGGGVGGGGEGGGERGDGDCGDRVSRTGGGGSVGGGDGRGGEGEGGKGAAVATITAASTTASVLGATSLAATEAARAAAMGAVATGVAERAAANEAAETEAVARAAAARAAERAPPAAAAASSSSFPSVLAIPARGPASISRLRGVSSMPVLPKARSVRTVSSRGERGLTRRPMEAPEPVNTAAVEEEAAQADASLAGAAAGRSAAAAGSAAAAVASAGVVDGTAATARTVAATAPPPATPSPYGQPSRFFINERLKTLEESVGGDEGARADAEDPAEADAARRAKETARAREKAARERLASSYASSPLTNDATRTGARSAADAKH